MMTFIGNARTMGMVDLNIRIADSKNRLAYLIDVYMFPPEDIDLNCEVLTWPKRINPVFEDHDEVGINLLSVYPGVHRFSTIPSTKSSIPERQASGCLQSWYILWLEILCVFAIGRWICLFYAKV